MSDEDYLYNLLAALVEQSRSLASRVAGDPEMETPCHFCGGALPLWENQLVLQLAGVPAHVTCPKEILDDRLTGVGPLSEFAYDEFSSAVDGRLKNSDIPLSLAGTVEDDTILPTTIAADSEC